MIPTKQFNLSIYMIFFNQRAIAGNLPGILIGLFFSAGLFGLGYWQGKRVVQHEIDALIARKSPAIHGNNGSRWTIPPVGDTISPTNNTPEMQEYLRNRTTLMNKMAELHQAHPNGPLDPKLIDQFKKDNVSLIQRQRELMQAIEQQQAQASISPPPPLQIPPDTSPQLKTYLTDRDQLMRDQIAFLNQHRTDDPATRQAAMQKWQQQNAARFQKLQQEAQALTKTKQT